MYRCIFYWFFAVINYWGATLIRLLAQQTFLCFWRPVDIWSYTLCLDVIHSICSHLLFFSSPEPKAHWWAYSIGRHPSYVICLSTFSNIFSSEATGPVEAKFYVRLYGSGERFKRSWSHDQDGHHAHIWLKLWKIFSRTEQPMILTFGMQHCVLDYCMYQIPSNGDPGLTLTYFMVRSDLVPYANGIN